MFFRTTASVLILVAGLSISGQAHADTLITEAEASLPPAGGQITTRGITRGPSIKVVSPTSQTSPMQLVVRIEPHGGAKLEPASLKVVYLKSPQVDLTDRIKPFVTADGINMTTATVPPGQHSLRIEIKDSDGRVGTASVDLTVTGSK